MIKKCEQEGVLLGPVGQISFRYVEEKGRGDFRWTGYNVTKGMWARLKGTENRK